MELSDFKPHTTELIGDLEVIKQDNNYPDYLNHFLLLKDYWHLEKDPNLALPLYLKSDSAYRV